MTSTVQNAFDLSLQVLAPNTLAKNPDHPTKLRSVPIHLDPNNLVHPNEPPISDLLYAGFLEHLGRCIYGGIVDDYRDPSSKDLLLTQDDPQRPETKGRLGWRKDVKQLLAKDGDLQVPMMRWPGGNFVSNYHWQDGIGPIEQRPKRVELAWLSSDPNLFGTDEFIDYCRGLKSEPFICLNSRYSLFRLVTTLTNLSGFRYDGGSPGMGRVLQWYRRHLVSMVCSMLGRVLKCYSWANLRRKNTGRDEPHKVTWWGLGNESEFDYYQLLILGTGADSDISVGTMASWQSDCD